MATLFKAERRERTGTGGARAVRRDHKVPAILYGGQGEPVKIAISAKDLQLAMRSARFFTTVCALELDGKIQHVLPREAQLHPVSDKALHLDFVRAEAGARVTVMIPVHFKNEAASPGLKRGGVLNMVRRDVELICPADAIPAEIVADLTGVDIGDSIHISHIPLPEGVRPTIQGRDFTVASIVPPTVVEATATEAAVVPAAEA